MSRRSIPILPDSTGREISLKHYFEINYVSGVGLDAFKVGDQVFGQDSGIFGIVTRVVTTSDTDGIIYIDLDETNPDGSYVNGENLLVNASVRAGVSTNKNIYSPKQTLVSYDNPFFGQKVDINGAAIVRFEEGPLEIDSNGRARISNATLIGEYGDNNYTVSAGVAYISSTIGSSLSFNSQSLAKVLTLSTGSNDHVKFVTNYFHKYIPGQSHLFEGSFMLGESGKDNVTYDWGYFSDTDGIFFRSTNRNLGVVVRNSSNGSVVDTFISQSSWNGDTVDGSNGSDNRTNINLDVTKLQQYWIDFQWPTGQIRWGIYQNGERLLLHKEKNFNSNTVPYMRTPTLPVQAEVYNNSSGSSSVSSLSFFDARVWTEGAFSPKTNTYQVSSGLKSVDNNIIPLMTLRPKDQVFGRDSRIISSLKAINILAKSGTQDVPVRVSLYGNLIPFTLSGSSFSAFSNVYSGIEVDNQATSFVSGVFLGDNFYSGIDNKDLNFTDLFGTKNIGNNFNIESKRAIIVAASTIQSGANADVEVTVSWDEVVD